MEIIVHLKTGIARYEFTEKSEFLGMLNRVLSECNQKVVVKLNAK